jgi:hypothetical protein
LIDGLLSRLQSWLDRFDDKLQQSAYSSPYTSNAYSSQDFVGIEEFLQSYARSEASNERRCEQQTSSRSKEHLLLGGQFFYRKVSGVEYFRISERL